MAFKGYFNNVNVDGNDYGVYPNDEYTNKNLIKVTRNESVDVNNTPYYWSAMCSWDGSPKEGENYILPTQGWWHVISMDWDGCEDGEYFMKSWISQLAIPTMDATRNGLDGIFYRHNAVNEINVISDNPWVRVLDENNYRGIIGNDSLVYHPVEFAFKQGDFTQNQLRDTFGAPHIDEYIGVTRTSSLGIYTDTINILGGYCPFIAFGGGDSSALFGVDFNINASTEHGIIVMAAPGDSQLGWAWLAKTERVKSLMRVEGTTLMLK